MCGVGHSRGPGRGGCRELDEGTGGTRGVVGSDRICLCHGDLQPSVHRVTLVWHITAAYCAHLGQHISLKIQSWGGFEKLMNS